MKDMMSNTGCCSVAVGSPGINCRIGCKLIWLSKRTFKRIPLREMFQH